MMSAELWQQLKPRSLVLAANLMLMAEVPASSVAALSKPSSSAIISGKGGDREEPPLRVDSALGQSCDMRFTAADLILGYRTRDQSRS
jgi:hypothetical protein